MSRMYFILFSVLIVSSIGAVTIDENLNEIYLEKDSLLHDNLVCEEKINELRSIDPNFLPQDMFESDKDYLKRICISAPKIIAIREKYIKPHIERLDSLRQFIFIDENIEVKLLDYNANQQEFNLFIERLGYPPVYYHATLSIASDDARFLYNNWDKVKYYGRGYISYDDNIEYFEVDLYSEEIEIYYEIDTLIPFSFAPKFENSSFNYDGTIFAGSYGKRVFVQKDMRDSLSFIYQKVFPENIKCLDLSPDGKYLAVGVHATPAGKIDFWLINIQTDRILFTVSVAGGIFSVNISPDGRLVAIGGGFTFTDSVAEIYEVETGKKLFDFSSYESINTVCFSPDQKYIVSLGSHLIIWNLITMKKELNESTPSHFIALDFHPNSQLLVVGGKYQGFKFYNMDSKCLMNSYERDKHVYSLSFNYNGNLLAIGFEDTKILNMNEWRYVNHIETTGGIYRPGTDFIVANGLAYKTTRKEDF